MTAEIVIMNKFGVALAADSAVSIGAQKVYNSANKLFSLSKFHPVGIMIYGNAQFMHIPWETIIKKYRDTHLRDGSFATLKEYSNNFLEYLAVSDIISDETEDYFLKMRHASIARQLVDQLREELKRHFEEGKGSITERQVKAKINEWLSVIRQGYKDVPELEGLTRAERADIKEKIGAVADELLGRCIQNLPFTSAQRKSLLSICFKLLFSTHDLGDNSGLVFAGYGSDEIFPKTEDVTLSGKIKSSLIVHSRSSQQIKVSMGASIAPYAQREMVDTIMKGIDPELDRQIRSLVDQSLQRLPGLLFEKHGIEISDEVKSAVERDLETIRKEMGNAFNLAQRENYIRPIIDSVGTLPPAELATMAETLINITSFKRRVTMVSESVGGPIDVALISKGDGFVWIKRKHYFDASLNSQFFLNQPRKAHG